MRVFRRFSDIIEANLSALLDAAEDPGKLVRMITREMEETLVEVRSTSAGYLAERTAVTEKLRRLRADVRDWDHKAEFAVTRGRDDLARAALEEKRRVEDSLTWLDADLRQINTAIGTLKRDTALLEEKLRMARVRHKALILRGRTAQSRIRVKRQLHSTTQADALARFESHEHRLNAMEGASESMDPGSQRLAAEIDELATNAQLDAELAALKQKLDKSVIDSPSSPVERSQS